MLQLYSEDVDIKKQDEKRYQAARLKLERKVRSIDFMLKESRCSAWNKQRLKTYLFDLIKNINP